MRRILSTLSKRITFYTYAVCVVSLGAPTLGDESRIMKQLERKLTITYRWWRTSGEDISDEHVEALDEHARERIAAMRKEDYTSGDLHESLTPDGADQDNSVEYTGWWEVVTTP